jgi:hypothetical protein
MGKNGDRHRPEIGPKDAGRSLPPHEVARRARLSVAPDDPEQFQRFVEAARELGIEEIGEAYERAVKAILRAPKPDQPMQRRIRGARPKKEQP